MTLASASVFASACTALRTGKAEDSGTDEDGGQSDGGPAGHGGSNDDGGGGVSGHAGNGGSGGEAGSTSGGSGGASGTSGDGGDGGGSGDASIDDAGPDSSIDAGPCDPGSEDCDASVSCTMCVPEAPGGWFGPVALADLEDSDCAAPFNTIELNLYDTLTAEEADCECHCDDLTASCGSLKFRQGPAAACGASGGTDTTLAEPDTCTSVPQQQSCGRGAFTAPPTDVGCIVKSYKTLPPLAWDAKLRACSAGQLDSTGCDSDEVCVPDGTTTFISTACVYRSGTHTCPTDFPSSMTATTGTVDTRDCGACSCPVTGTAVCSTTLGAFNSDACTSATGTIPVTGSAGSDPLGTIPDPMWMMWSEPTVSGATCTPTGGAPLGSVSETGLTTICCR